MELNALRSAVTVFSFVVFIGIIYWTWNKQRKSAFDAAAQVPLMDDGSDADGAAQRSNGAQ
jgi:cytochrome c oxidase cbb3-type subunit 4